MIMYLFTNIMKTKDAKLAADVIIIYFNFLSYFIISLKSTYRKSGSFNCINSFHILFFHKTDSVYLLFRTQPNLLLVKKARKQQMMMMSSVVGQKQINNQRLLLYTFYYSNRYHDYGIHH